MKITTKGRYALEIISDLALYSDDKKLESLKHIANRRGLSEKYLERIVKALKNAGLVESVRGVHGGYRLKKPAGKISVREVLTAVEGELAPVECLTKETDCGIECNMCPTRRTWERLWKEILETVEKISIEDVLREVKKEIDISTSMGYNIKI